MDRRNFIKSTLLTGAVVATEVILNKEVLSENNNTEKKSMKILIITGSPRKNGNSNFLVDNFIKGAQEKGHQIFRFDSAFKKVHPCIACNKCGMNGDCIFNDDFNYVRENLVDSDMVVFATPMYYFGISAQIKTVIDRFYAINGKIHIPKKTALIMTYADTEEKEAQPIKKHFETLINYLGWTNVGEIVASGVWTQGSVKNTKYPKMAYELGKNL